LQELVKVAIVASSCGPVPAKVMNRLIDSQLIGSGVDMLLFSSCIALGRLKNVPIEQSLIGGGIGTDEIRCGSNWPETGV
jgi:hypothetical protein